MSSKDMLDKLHEMKIPAKSHASMLAEASVEKVRKNLAPEIKERAGELPAEEAKQLAEERAEAKRQKAEQERARREAVEQERAAREAERARRAEEGGQARLKACNIRSSPRRSAWRAKPPSARLVRAQLPWPRK